MNQQYLENLANAKESLKIWLSNLEQKHNGNQMFSQENEIDRLKTDFAKWYYNEGQTFSSFETFRNIEVFYNRMYDLFLEYNTLYAKPIKKSFFSNKFEKQKQALNVLFKSVEIRSKELMDSVIVFQNSLLKSPLFKDVERTEIGVDTKEAILEQDIVEGQQTTQIDEPIHEEVAETKFETDKEVVKTDEISQAVDKSAAEDSPASKITEEDIKAIELEVAAEEQLEEVKEVKEEIEATEVALHTDSETEQTKEKKAILEISKTEKKKNPTENLKILSEIDIEEEIRRILS